MKERVQEQFITLFSIALAIIAVSTMIYMVRTPSITGTVALEGLDATSTILVVSLLILAGLAVVLGAIIAIHKLKKEVSQHQTAIGEQKTMLLEQPKDELGTYVVHAYEKGYTDQQIASRLSLLGWSKKDIASHISTIKNQKS